jgi:hypothetical protein
MVTITSPGKIPIPLAELPTGNEGLLHIAHCGNKIPSKKVKISILLIINII